MIVVMQKEASRSQIVNLTARIEQLGCQAHISEGEERTIIGIVGNGRPLDHEQIGRMAGVERTVPVLRPFKLASREFHPKDTTVSVHDINIGEQLNGESDLFRIVRHKVLGSHHRRHPVDGLQIARPAQDVDVLEIRIPGDRSQPCVLRHVGE